MTFLTKQLSVTEIGNGSWALNDPLIYEGRDHHFMVPTGFVTDFATVPGFVRSLYPPQGAYNKPAILHDYFCEDLKRYRNEVKAAEKIEDLEGRRKALEAITPPVVSSVDADGIFRRTMAEQDVKIVRRWMMWTGVRLGAMGSAHRRAGSLETLPMVSLISLLAFPIFFLLLLVNGTIGLLEKILP